MHFLTCPSPRPRRYLPCSCPGPWGQKPWHQPAGTSLLNANLVPTIWAEEDSPLFQVTLDEMRSNYGSAIAFLRLPHVQKSPLVAFLSWLWEEIYAICCPLFCPTCRVTATQDRHRNKPGKATGAAGLQGLLLWLL